MNRDGEFVHYDKEGHRYPQKFLSTVSNFEFVKNSNNIITGSINSNVVYSNIQTKVNSILYPHSGGEVCCLAISPNGKYIASSAIGDNSILLYDLEENKKLPPLDGHKNTIKALAFSPDSNLLGSGDNGAMLFYWDMTKRGKEAFKLSFQWSGNEINDVIFHPFHFIFAATGADHRVKLFDMGNNNKKLEDLLGHGKYINSIAFSPDGKFLASGSQDHTIRIWNIKKPNHVA
jgi:WD40 repeat protein